MRLAIVIPAYNEADRIADVVKNIPSQLRGISWQKIIVVNDASKDHTAAVARKNKAIVVDHRLNLGVGGATLTGLMAAKKLGAEVAVSLDADGQHNPNNIQRLIDAYQRGEGDLIIGSRFLSETIQKMPLLRRIGNRSIMNRITKIFSGKAVTDSQSGFRLFGHKLMDNLHEFTTSGYEFCSETIIIVSRNNWKISEVPIDTIYDNTRKTGQHPINGLNILLRLMFKFVVG